MPQAKVQVESFSFSPSALLELFTLNGTAIGMSTIYRFVNASNGVFQAVTFNGVQYTPFPIFVEGMELNGKGELSRPRLSVSNINGFTSALIRANGNSLDGATVTRQRVFARYIDSVNFPANEPLPSWVTPDSTACYPEEPWMINRKLKEDPQVVTWELGCPVETNNRTIPRRQIIANICQWSYRQTGTCNYSGVPVADGQNRLFTGSYYSITPNNRGTYDAAETYNRGDYVVYYSSIPQYAAIPTVWVCLVNSTAGVTPSSTTARWVQDKCTKSCAACKLRFANGQALRTSAFPGSSRADWTVRSR